MSTIFTLYKLFRNYFRFHIAYFRALEPSLRITDVRSSRQNVATQRENCLAKT